MTATATPTPSSVSGGRAAARRAARLPVAGAGRRQHNRHLLANIAAGVFSVIWIFPVYWMINTALKPRTEVMTATPHFVPFHPTLENFVHAVGQTTFLRNLLNSVIVVFAAVIIGILVALFASAALSRFRFRGRRLIMIIILAVQMLPVGALLIPQFLIFRDLNLLNHYFGLILAYVAAVLPFSIWSLRGFFITIPVEVEEAAMIDGAGTWTILWRVLFPLVVPGVIATSVFAFISAWNEYVVALTFMKSTTMYTLPIWLASFSTPLTGTDYGGLMAGSVLFSLPVVVIFLIIQRHLVVGMSAGAVKG